MSGARWEVLRGDCRTVMSLLIDPESIDSIVCDPPYELGFMGKGWDSTGIANSVEMWRAAYACLKPGGHLLAFSGTRTYHRMVCAIEDAGFEIRDQIGWVFGSGFPKSLDVSKAIDKAAGAERTKVLIPTKAGNAARRGEGEQGVTFGDSHGGFTDISEPVTDEARQWEGWGTALKPAWEPVVVARKPLAEKTVASNVLEHGTGALNIDACRVPVNESVDAAQLRTMNRSQRDGSDGWGMSAASGDTPIVLRPEGRWPANLIHDGSDEVLAAFPQAPGQLADASSFFYCAKASKRDRNEGLDGFTPTTTDGRAIAADNAYQRGKTERANTHPTVKPTDLMRYLCRLVTPPGGTVLDPFTGSGTTGKAAMLEGFRFVGCELSDEYANIAEARIAAATASLLRAAA